MKAQIQVNAQPAISALNSLIEKVFSVQSAIDPKAAISDLYAECNPVGVLFFHDYPVTTVFDADGIPVIKEWVDATDEWADIYFTYRVQKEILLDFMEGKISHREMIMSCINGIGFMHEEKDGAMLNVKTMPPSELPEEYLPNADAALDVSDMVDVEDIFRHFSQNQ